MFGLWEPSSTRSFSPPTRATILSWQARSASWKAATVALTLCHRLLLCSTFFLSRRQWSSPSMLLTKAMASSLRSPSFLASGRISVAYVLSAPDTFSRSLANALDFVATGAVVAKSRSASGAL